MNKIQDLRNSGKHLAHILSILESKVKSGVTGIELDEIMDNYCKKNNVIASFKGFKNYPASICVCINDEIVHGIPDKRPFKDGDLVTVDAGITYNGWITDSARSVIIGDNINAKRLSDGTKSALDKAVSIIRPGVKVGEVSRVIENEIKKHDLYVISEFCGHGVGKTLHGEPQIPNETTSFFSEYILKEGEVIAIEPIVALKPTDIYLKPDGWCYSTYNGILSCQWEHTIIITEKGCEVLTK